MKYLKIFNTLADYQNAENSLSKPNVSMIGIKRPFLVKYKSRIKGNMN